MAWQRGKYYVKSVRQGARVKSVYVGAGLIGAVAADIDQIERVERDLAREAQRLLLAELTAQSAPPEVMQEHGQIVAGLVHSVLIAAGYHRHKRQWRKRRMTDQLATAPTRAEFSALFKRAASNQAKESDLKDLRRVVAANPEYGRAMDLSELAIGALIDGMPADKAGKAIARGRADALRLELGGPNPTAIERLLIDQVILSFLHLNMVEYQTTNLWEKSASIIEFWEKRLDQCQARYHRAIFELVRVRRLLKLPPLQININQAGGQMVAVAGDVSV